MVLSFLEEELDYIESLHAKEESVNDGVRHDDSRLSSSLWLDEVVIHLIPVTEQARFARRIDGIATFLKIAVLFNRGWLLITSNLRTVPPLQHTMDLFLSQWTSTLPLLIAFSADALVFCSPVLVELLCNAMYSIYERLSTTHYDDRGGAVVAEWNINHEVVLEVARSLARIGSRGRDDTGVAQRPEDSCCVGVSLVASPFAYLCSAYGVGYSIHRLVATFRVEDSTMQHVFVTPPWKVHVDRLAESASSLDEIARDMIKNHIARFLKRAVLPALYCEKWTSNAKYYGGRLPSHSISFYYGALLVQAKRNDMACRMNATAALEVGRTPMQPLSCTPCESQRRRIAQEIFHCSLLNFLKEYFAFLCDAISLKGTSINRRDQLKTDVAYVVRLTRMCRLLMSPEIRVELDLLLVRIVSVASVRFCATGVRSDLVDASAAEMPCCFEPPHSFMACVWDVTPIDGWMELHQLSCASLSLCHHEGFVRWISHSQLTTVEFPSPHLDVRCLQPVAATASHRCCGAAQQYLLRLPASGGVRRLYQTLPPGVVEELLASSP